MIRRPPRSTRTDTLVPYTTLVRSTLKGDRWFCMAGIWREYKDGEAFTLLTMDSGPDIAAYHHRQIIPLARDQWAAWLDPRVPAADVLKWLPEGRSEEHTSELQSLMRISYAVFCLKKTK